jgi:hypothetical protein
MGGEERLVGGIWGFEVGTGKGQRGIILAQGGESWEVNLDLIISGS